MHVFAKRTRRMLSYPQPRRGCAAADSRRTLARRSSVRSSNRDRTHARTHARTQAPAHMLALALTTGSWDRRPLHGTARLLPASRVCQVFRVRDRRPLHGTARLAGLRVYASVGGSAGLAAYGSRSLVPPTLATRGSLLNGAWEPRLQTAPQEPKRSMRVVEKRRKE